jgi:hypothetical protein
MNNEFDPSELWCFHETILPESNEDSFDEAEVWLAAQDVPDWTMIGGDW